MRHSLSLLTAATLIALGAPVFAQDATTTDPAAEGQTATDLGLDMGTSPGAAQGGQLQAGQFYIRQEFGDWAMRCVAIPDGPDPCELYQLLNGADGPVAEFSVFPLPEGGQAVAGATVVAPLETLLTEGLVLAVDGGAPRQYEFSYCNRAGCVARIGLTADDLAAFKRGNAASLRIVPAAAPDQPFDLAISLTGFTAAFDGSSVYDQSAAPAEGEPDVAAPPAETTEPAPAPAEGAAEPAPAEGN